MAALVTGGTQLDSIGTNYYPSLMNVKIWRDTPGESLLVSADR